MSICKKLIAGLSLGCESTINKRYAQEVVLINKDDIATVTKIISADTKYSHNVTFDLKASAKGFKFILPANGSGVFGSVEKSTSDLGLTQYNHIANMLIFGADETSKGVLESLDKGRMIAVLKIGDIIEVYGIDNGLSTADYTLDIQGGAGASAIQLSSGEGFEESNLPLVYTAGEGGDPLADFDAGFAG
ncbi:hypothetical protein [Empedobacter stercoris]|uniref:hypothetical protein n=1 Tax=Empedobacter stercoris TaxID=1628248 RepID=UPI0039EA4CAB